MIGISSMSSRPALAPDRALLIAKFYMEIAHKTDDPDIAIEFCNDATIALARIKKSAKRTLVSSQAYDDFKIREGIALIFYQQGLRLKGLGHDDPADQSFKKASKWRQYNTSRHSYSRASSMFSRSSRALDLDVATLHVDIFPRDRTPAILRLDLPSSDERLLDTPQLVYCLSLMPSPSLHAPALTRTERDWSQAKVNDLEEQARLQRLEESIVAEFIHDPSKTAASVAEVASLGPVLDHKHHKLLFTAFVNSIKDSNQQNRIEPYQFVGLALLMQHAPPVHFDRNDLIAVLDILSHFNSIHPEPSKDMYQVVFSISVILDAFVSNQVKGLRPEQLHESLLSYLKMLKRNSDPFLVYHAAHGLQALQHIPDNETLIDAALRRTPSTPARGLFGALETVKALDIDSFMDGLQDIQEEQSSTSTKTSNDHGGTAVYENVASLAENGPVLMESLQAGSSFERKTAWYPAIRLADQLLEAGQIAKFRTLVCEAACRREMAFQWGACQQLGNMAASTLWDMTTRQGAVSFLAEIYKNDREWGEHVVIKQLVVAILGSLASEPDCNLHAAQVALKDLESDGTPKKQALFRSSRNATWARDTLSIPIPSVKPPSLLDRVQNKPNVEKNLRVLKKRRCKDRGHSFYIPLLARPSLKTGDGNTFYLVDKAKEFLTSPQKVMLVLGDSGSGKSTFTREVEQELWETYDKDSSRIPLRINLPSIDKPERDMVVKQLHKDGFSDTEIKDMKENRRFVLICDGYDECLQTHNLYTSNRLNQPGEFQAQMIVCCRPEYLSKDYRDRFQPIDRNHQEEPSLFLETVIEPFSKDQIDAFVKSYVSTNSPLWQAKDYLASLYQTPGLQELASSPFLLAITLEILPWMSNPCHSPASAQMTRVVLYDQFVEHWLERSRIRLNEVLAPKDRAAFEALSDGGFVRRAMAFLKDLAVAVYENQGGNPVVEYIAASDQRTWKESFFSSDSQKRLLLEACPLVRSGNQFQFIHRSILEYALSRAIIKPLGDGKDSSISYETTTKSSRRRLRVMSMMSFELPDIADQRRPVAVTPEPDFSSPLAVRNFINEPSIMQFLVERAQQQPQFRQQLLSYIEHSKQDKQWRTAAANAITILVRAKVPFSGLDLRGIQVPGADLSNGIFDSTQLQGADLRKVNFGSTWIRNANLQKSKLTGAEFGEWPYLEVDSTVRTFTFSPNGWTLAIGLGTGAIKIYDPQTWEQVQILGGHADGVFDIKYSPNGQHLASCSCDRTVMVWDVQSGQLLHTLQGHTEVVRNLAYSPSGRQILSCGDDNTVRLWDALLGEPIRTFGGISMRLRRGVFSPDGAQIATCGQDDFVRLWDAETGQLLQTLEGHESDLSDVQYSTNGDQLATSSMDGTVRFWDTQTWEPSSMVLDGHDEYGCHLIYSNSGRLIVTIDFVGTVRLWNLQTGAILMEVNGDEKLAFSPDDSQVILCAEDGNVRVYDTQTGQLIHTFPSHDHQVWKIGFSPSGHQIVTCSDDGTVRLWTTKFLDDSRTFQGHSSTASRVIVSPDGHFVASSSHDKTVRLWDTRTGRFLKAFTGDQAHMERIHFAANGNRIASGDLDDNVYLWDVKSGQQVLQLKSKGKIHYGAYGSENLEVWDVSPDGNKIVFKDEDNVIYLKEVWSDQVLQTVKVDNFQCLAFSPDGQQITMADFDGNIQQWDTLSGQISRLEGSSTMGGLWKLLYSTDGRHLATCSDNKIQLWDGLSGQAGHVLTHDDDGGQVLCMAFAPDGEQIATGTSRGYIYLWGVPFGQLLYKLTDRSFRVAIIAYSPSSRLVATGSHDSTVRLWDTQSGQCLASVDQFRGAIHAISWTTVHEMVGEILVTGDSEGSVKMWHVLETAKKIKGGGAGEKIKDEKTEDADQCTVQLQWSTHRVGLNAEQAKIQDTHGLNQVNKKLLIQRGAVGEPARPLSFYETAKRMSAVVTAASKLKTLASVKRMGSDAKTVSTTSGGGSPCPLIAAQQAEASEAIKIREVACSVCNVTHVVRMQLRID